MKLFKNIVMKLVWCILILLVAFNIYNFVSINILHKDLATVNGYALLEVVSGSMEPTLDIGDLIVIDTLKASYKKGDIVTFKDVNGAFVTHRIIRTDGVKMVTQGDANNTEDEEMSTDAIVGKFVYQIPKAGKIISSLKNPIVMLLILIIGIVFCFLVSTDKDLVPKDLTEEEKEFLEYKKNKEEKIEKEDLKEEIISEELPKAEVKVVKRTTKTASKTPTTVKTTKKTATKKTTQAKSEKKKSEQNTTSNATKKSTKKVVSNKTTAGKKKNPPKKNVKKESK